MEKGEKSWQQKQMVEAIVTRAVRNQQYALLVRWHPNARNELLPMRCIVARPADSSGIWNEMKNEQMWNACVSKHVHVWLWLAVWRYM